MTSRTVGLIFDLSIVTAVALAILALVPEAFLFYAAGIAFGYGLHAGIAKRNAMAPILKPKDRKK